MVGPNDPHHLRYGEAAKERSIGRKSTDRRVIPLCRVHHDAAHALGSRRERAYFAEWGYEALAVSEALWLNSGDLSRMNRVLLAHKLAASRELLMRKKP